MMKLDKSVGWKIIAFRAGYALVQGEIKLYPFFTLEHARRVKDDLEMVGGFLSRV